MNFNNPDINEISKELRTKLNPEDFVRDKAIISKLIKNNDINTSAGITEVYRTIVSDKISFSSPYGHYFDDYIYDLYSKVRSGQFEDSESTVADKNNKKNKTNKINNKNKTNIKTAKVNNTRHKSDKSDFDEMSDAMKKEVINEIKRKDRRRKFLIAGLSLVAVCCFGYFVYYYYSLDKAERRFENLSSLIGSEAMSTDTTEKIYNATLSEEVEISAEILKKYKTLYNSNKKLIGWLKIDDTNIDYPVMQCGDNEYYLSHNFDSEEDKAGALFLDCNCDALRGNTNFIIYGHHLQSGRMFSTLINYENESYYRKHKYIQFDTIYEEHTYEVMYVFRSHVYREDDIAFKYYQFIDVNSEEEFYSYMNEMKAESFYDTGVTASYGDHLLTLSTCDYHEDNGRFVVVAKQIK